MEPATRSKSCAFCRRESAEENAAVLGELLFDVVAIIFRPVGEVDLVRGGFQDQRQRLIVLQPAFANRVEAGKIDGFAANRTQAFLGRVDGFFHDDLLLLPRRF